MKKKIETISTSIRNRKKRNTINVEEILKTSLKIIKENGIEKLSMRSIAKELNSSVGSAYNYFETREKIIQELLFRGEQKLYQDVLIAKKKAKDSENELVLIAYAYWNFAIENIELHKLMFSVGGGQHKKLFTQPNSYRIFLKSIYSYTKKQKSKKIKPKDYNSLARTVWSWMYGLLVLNMAGVLTKGSATYKPIEDGMNFFKRLIDNE